jgi:hypothetical protein
MSEHSIGLQNRLTKNELLRTAILKFVPKVMAIL